MTSVDTNTQWREDWSSASVVNHTIVINPTIRQPGFDLPRHTWSLTIRFRTCRANLNKWGLAQSPSCDSSQRKTMNHTVDTCPLTKFEGGLNLLHEVDDDAVIWLEATATAALAEQIITSYSQTEWVAAYRLYCCRHARPSQTSPGCCAASPSLKQRHHRWCQAEAASSAAAAAGVTPAAEQRESTTAASLQTSPDRQPYKHTHTHPFNDPLSGTTRVSQYQKGKTNLDFTEARDSEWQWHHLGHMQVCTSLQADNHARTPPLTFFYRPDVLPAAQPTASKH